MNLVRLLLFPHFFIIMSAAKLATRIQKRVIVDLIHIYIFNENPCVIYLKYKNECVCVY